MVRILTVSLADLHSAKRSLFGPATFGHCLLFIQIRMLLFRMVPMRIAQFRIRHCATNGAAMLVFATVRPFT